jgi:hypothetical protein
VVGRARIGRSVADICIVVRNSQPTRCWLSIPPPCVWNLGSRNQKRSHRSKERGITTVHKDNTNNGLQPGDPSPVRIETIEELLRKRGFFDSAERWNREHQKNAEAVAN